LLGLTWVYRWGCIKVLAFQIVLLTMGMLGLGLMGVGVDYVRYVVSSRPEVGVTVAAPSAPAATPAARAVPKPPRWPLGLVPPTDWTPTHVVTALAVGILVLALIRSVLNFGYTVAMNRLVQMEVVVDLRAKVYAKMQRLSFRFYDANASGSLINRVTTDVQAVRLFIDGVAIQSMILGLSLAVYLVYMLSIDGRLTFACLATTPLLWTTTVRFSRRVQPAYRRERALFDRQVLMLSESLRGIQVIKGFARQKEEIERFAAASRAVAGQKRWIFRVTSTFQPLIGLFTQINLVVMLAYGGYLVVCHDRAPGLDEAVRAGLSVGQLLVFAGLLQQFSGQVANIANIANSMQQSLTGAQRVFEILDTPVEIASPPRAVRMPRVRGEIEFDHVSFAYTAGEPVLEDLCFRVGPGQCAAILGATGSGKSALLSLIPRFYDPTAGRILADGMDIRQLDLDDWRRQIGVVFQESFLFSNSAAANIAFGHVHATREEIERAARIAAAHDFIMAMPEGYDTILREGGTDLSGGQRQRLAIARAVLPDPAILLLDDPTAAVDMTTEDDILDAIETAMARRTTFMVANRLSTLRRADRIIVLDRGRIVQSGTHEELISVKGHYRWAASLQIPDQKSLDLLAQIEGAES
jgi:ATP-binding cassette subfamily B protein